MEAPAAEGSVGEANVGSRGALLEKPFKENDIEGYFYMPFKLLIRTL